MQNQVPLTGTGARDSKSSYKSSDSRMLNSTILIFFLNSNLGNTQTFVGNSFQSFTPAQEKDCLFISSLDLCIYIIRYRRSCIIGMYFLCGEK